MLGRVGVDRVQHAGVVAAPIALGELLVQRRVLRERHVLQVARQADQHRATGLGVDAGHRHAVGPQPDPALPGVAAQQQDVVAALLGLWSRRRRRTPCSSGRAGPTRSRPRPPGRRPRRATTADAQGREAEPVPTGQLWRPGEPPGVDEQQTPAEAEHDQERPEQRSAGRGRGEQTDDRRIAPDQGEQRRPAARSTHSPAQIRRAIRPTRLLPAAICADPGSTRVMAKEGQRATQLDPLAALLRGPRRRSGHGARRPRRDQTPGGLSVCSGKRESGFEIPVSMSAQDLAPRAARRTPLSGLARRSPRVPLPYAPEAATTTSTGCTVAIAGRPSPSPPG